MSSSNCCFLTCIQISQVAGKVVCYSPLLKNFPVCFDLHSHRLWCSKYSRIRCFSGTLAFLDNPTDVGNLIPGSSAFSKSSLNIWKFIVHVLLKPCLESFEHYIASVWDECNCTVVWTFFCIAFLRDWKENWPFPVPWPLLSSVIKVSDRTAITRRLKWGCIICFQVQL